MKPAARASVVWFALAVASFAWSGVAFAQPGWVPQRNVELVVPMAAGGSIDLLARAIQRVWTEGKFLPVSSTIVNRGGAGQVMAYHYVHQHPGNPHVIGVMSSNVLTSHVAGRMPLGYADFTTIALLVTGSYFALAVRADSPYRTARDLVEALRRNPGAVSVGLGGAAGGAHHIALGLPLQTAEVDIGKVRTVSFNDSALLAAALLGGHVDAAMATLINVAPHAESGKLRLLALSSPRRLTGPLASVPVWPELGYKGVWEGWRGLYAAKGVTLAQVSYWEVLAHRVTQDDEFRRFAESNDLEVSYRGAAATQQWLEQQFVDVKNVMTYLGYAKALVQ